MKILVTGGAGYIGSHTCVELLNEGYEVVVVDNLSNSSMESLQRVEEITGKKLQFYKKDIGDELELEKVFAENEIDAVIHFAGLKSVGESVKFPLTYYKNNLTGTLVLCEVMNKFKVKNIVFSSSATVYGIPEQVPISENAPLNSINPYGRSKLIIENVLTDIFKSDPEWSIAILRYFNPIGAHESGLIGEDPDGIPNNLTPYITQVAIGKLDKLKVFGADYPTEDGTGVRDYIHVTDLARGHIKALKKIMPRYGVDSYNLGTGKGYTVLEVVKAFERVSEVKIPYTITEKRPGDAAICFADPNKAKRELGWVAKKGLEEMCRDAWRWQTKNPRGYTVPV